MSLVIGTGAMSRTMKLCPRGALIAAAVALGAPSAAQSPVAPSLDPPSWTRPVPPFRIVGNIYYVGSEGLASYLVKTERGDILIDGTMAANVPMIERNLATIGVRMRDIKYLLLTHAHFDHAGGLARLKADSGAQLIVGAGDRIAVQTGKAPGESLTGGVDFPAAAVDRGIGEGETVRLGATTLVAHATPGHTPGCTTWTLQMFERGTPLRVVIPCSLTVAGNRLVGNRRYPGIVGDYRASFARMAAIRADVVLPAHPELADVHGRRVRRDAGQRNAFVDRALLGTIVARARIAFAADLAAQTGRK
ncbi:MAG: subclass metallo-beta-lactamase [Sphingomonas bacterium]|uniref:subclass B3 metallo-beta-lactamase n=1 Tax=Sphingomonas bacterium TaxID=1895847 RepID=UPI002608E68C|nr:subclass B3 metallo-beta-lactamase [Sphingomonas bacterium]MDB5707794.1 subclass metallo-beta-lactamase [Sphingomonas bacterium]